MALDGLTDRVRTADGYHFIRFVQVAEVGVTRRDDLRGCWEVAGTIYADRGQAFDAAEALLDSAEEPPEPDDSSPDLAERVSTGAQRSPL